MSVTRLRKRPCPLLCWDGSLSNKHVEVAPIISCGFDPVSCTKKNLPGGGFSVFFARSLNVTPSSTYALMRRKDTLNTLVKDIVDPLFHCGDGLCRNYALQREETGMLIMCKPLVWFCIN